MATCSIATVTLALLRLLLDANFALDMMPRAALHIRSICPPENASELLAVASVTAKLGPLSVILAALNVGPLPSTELSIMPSQDRLELPCDADSAVVVVETKVFGHDAYIAYYYSNMTLASQLVIDGRWCITTKHNLVPGGVAAAGPNWIGHKMHAQVASMTSHAKYKHLPACLAEHIGETAAQNARQAIISWGVGEPCPTVPVLVRPDRGPIGLVMATTGSKEPMGDGLWVHGTEDSTWSFFLFHEPDTGLLCFRLFADGQEATVVRVGERS